MKLFRDFIWFVVAFYRWRSWKYEGKRWMTDEHLILELKTPQSQEGDKG